MAGSADRHRDAAARHEQAAGTHERAERFWEQHGKATRAALRPLVDGARTLRAPRGQQIDGISVDGKPLPVKSNPDGTVTVHLTARRSYAVLFR